MLNISLNLNFVLICFYDIIYFIRLTPRMIEPIHFCPYYNNNNIPLTYWKMNFALNIFKRELVSLPVEFLKAKKLFRLIDVYARFRSCCRAGVSNSKWLAAAWDSNYGLAGRIEKKKKILRQKSMYVIKIGQMAKFFIKNLNLSWCLRAACCRPLL